MSYGETQGKAANKWELSRFAGFCKAKVHLIGSGELGGLGEACQGPKVGWRLLSSHRVVM